MTHDELLWAINSVVENGPCESVGHWSSAKALRAVVELHKPTDRGFDWLDKEWCSICLQELDEYNPPIEVKYPCPTIQAIEKELE